MLFKSAIACFVWEMVYVRLKLCVQRDTKNTQALQPMGGNILKCILTYLCFTKCNEIIIPHLGIGKDISHKKWYE